MNEQVQEAADLIVSRLEWNGPMTGKQLASIRRHNGIKLTIWLKAASHLSYTERIERKDGLYTLVDPDHAEPETLGARSV